jgi:hypothetical protein
MEELLTEYTGARSGAVGGSASGEGKVVEARSRFK